MTHCSSKGTASSWSTGDAARVTGQVCFSPEDFDVEGESERGAAA